MTSPGGIRRVTAVLDAASHGDGLLATAAEFAARLHAEVQALLLQDTNLHRLAELGIARMVSLFAAAEPALPAEAVAMLERLVSDAQSALEAAALVLGVPWSFRVLQGDAPAELSRWVADGELLVVNVGDGLTGGNPRFGLALWQATEGRRAALLLLHRQLPRPVPALLAVGQTSATERALAVAAALQPAGRRQLEVLSVGSDTDAATAVPWIRQHHRVRVTTIPAPSVEALAAAVHRVKANLLLIPADLPGLDAERIGTLVDRSGCALLLVR